MALDVLLSGDLGTIVRKPEKEKKESISYSVSKEEGNEGAAMEMEVAGVCSIFYLQ